VPRPRARLRHSPGRLVLRAIGFTGFSVGMGAAWGAIAGSMVPLAGTMFGGFLGAANGALLGLIGGAVVASRPLGRVFRRLTVVVTPIALAVGVFGFFAIFYTVDTDDDDTLAFAGGWIVTSLAFLAIVVHARLTLPVARIRVRGGHCAACGYNASGLSTNRCPECGRTLTGIELGRRPASGGVT